MTAEARIRSEDIAAIGLAVIAHIAIVAWLVFAPRPKAPPVERMTVTLDGIVSPDAGSPSREEARAASAPQLGEEPAPAPAAAAAELQPAPPRIQPPPQLAPAPRAVPRPVPAPPLRASPPRPRIDSNFLPPTPKGASAPARKPAGASRIGDDFLRGASEGAGKAATPPGPAITPELRISFAQAVLRQVRPNWQGRVPQGLDTDKLISVIGIELNRDGTLAGAPVLLRQEGINDANRSQAQRHAEEAIRAVRLSAPFRLPPEAYEGWKKLPPLRFRKGS